MPKNRPTRLSRALWNQLAGADRPLRSTQREHWSQGIHDMNHPDAYSSFIENSPVYLKSFSEASCLELIAEGIIPHSAATSQKNGFRHRLPFTTLPQGGHACTDDLNVEWSDITTWYFACWGRMSKRHQKRKHVPQTGVGPLRTGTIDAAFLCTLRRVGSPCTPRLLGRKDQHWQSP